MRKRPACSLQAGRDNDGSIGDDPARVEFVLRLDRLEVAKSNRARDQAIRSDRECPSLPLASRHVRVVTGVPRAVR